MKKCHTPKLTKFFGRFEMALQIEIQNNKFRVIAQEFQTKWLANTPGNRKVVVILLRSLEDENGKSLFTFQELSAIVGSDNRQAASQHMEDFRECGEDFYETLNCKRKVDEEVVQAVVAILREEPLAKGVDIQKRVNELLGRRDISAQNVQAALEQISCKEIRAIIRKQLERGEIHYSQEYVISRLFEMVLATSSQSPTLPPVAQEMINEVKKAIEPIGEHQQLNSKMSEEIKSLFQGEMNFAKLAIVWTTPLGWKIWALLLYLQGVSLAAIGGWLGVHKSTICRWLKDVESWATLWLNEKEVASSGKVAVDEKWIMIDGVFWYLFAAVDCITGCPLHVALYPSNSGVYCKLFLLELKRLGYRPTVIITDGWDAYVKAISAVFPYAQHLYCRFHALHSLFRRLRRAYIFNTPVFKLACKLFKSAYKRTVQRRVARLHTMLEGIHAGHALSGLLLKLPNLLKTVGSLRLPTTANAVEGFFGAFDRLYRLKGPFCDQASAQKHLRLFMLGYMLTIGQQGQPCPLEKAGADVSHIPLYHLLNRPNVISLKEKMAQQYQQRQAA
jgi:transposase-like protein